MANKNCECGSGVCQALCASPFISFGIVLIVTLAGFLAGAAFSPKAGLAGNLTLSTPVEHTISVNGDAQQTVTPDLLVLSISVETQEDSAALSQRRNAEIMGNVKSALLSKGVLEKEISTSSYYTYPVEQSHWVCPDTKPDCKDDEKVYVTKIVGYKTAHTLTVKTTDLANGGTLVDVAVSAGATNINSISFTLKDETRRALEESLLKYASANAKGKAQKIADGLGVKLGGPASASSSYVYFPGPIYRSYSVRDAGALPASTNLSPGEMIVTASVSVSYLME